EIVGSTSIQRIPEGGNDGSSLNRAQLPSRHIAYDHASSGISTSFSSRYFSAPGCNGTVSPSVASSNVISSAAAWELWMASRLSKKTSVMSYTASSLSSELAIRWFITPTVSTSSDCSYVSPGISSSIKKSYSSSSLSLPSPSIGTTMKSVFVASSVSEGLGTPEVTNAASI